MTSMVIVSKGPQSLAVATINSIYTAQVTVTGGRRKGHAVSNDGVLDLKLKLPGASGDPQATNPEQLFAAGYAACYQSALMGAAHRAGEDASSSTVHAAVSLGKEEGTEAYGLSVVLTVDIPGLARAKVEELANAAHETCPYSRATRGNIDVQVVVAG